MDSASGDRFVTPFYLEMMRTNAATASDELISAVEEDGRHVTAEIVIAMLADPWRSTVMGAWFAVGLTDPDVTDAVVAALGQSQGSLTSPPLMTASVVLADSAAVPGLADYLDRDLAHGWGSSGFAAAAIEHLGGTVSKGHSTRRDRTEWQQLLAVGTRLREAAEAR